MFTESHRVFRDEFFRPSLPKDLIYNEYTCEDFYGGNHGEGDFWQIARRKAAYMKYVVVNNFGDTVVWSDVDIVFFVDRIKDILLRSLGEHDIACQEDRPNSPCSGFCVIRCNNAMIDSFDKIVTECPRKNGNTHDQSILVKYWNQYDTTLLDRDMFWNLRTVGTRPLKEIGLPEFHVPKNIVMYHANWISSLELKKQALTQVRLETVQNND